MPRGVEPDLIRYSLACCCRFCQIIPNHVATQVFTITGNAAEAGHADMLPFSLMLLIGSVAFPFEHHQRMSLHGPRRKDPLLVQIKPDLHLLLELWGACPGRACGGVCGPRAHIEKYVSCIVTETFQVPSRLRVPWQSDTAQRSHQQQRPPCRLWKHTC